MPVKAPRCRTAAAGERLCRALRRLGADEVYRLQRLPDDRRVNGWALGGAGRATWWWAPNYSLQLDAQGEGTSHKYHFGGGGSSSASRRTAT